MQSGAEVTTRYARAYLGASKYSYDARHVLQKVWEASGGQCGKYLAASMEFQFDLLEAHGELVDGLGRYTKAVRGELMSMSAASIDRCLAPSKARGMVRGWLANHNAA